MAGVGEVGPEMAISPMWASRTVKVALTGFHALSSLYLGLSRPGLPAEPENMPDRMYGVGQKEQVLAIVVVGSVALDSVETPFRKVDNVLGGAASYFSLAAALYAPVNLVAIIGDD